MDASTGVNIFFADNTNTFLSSSPSEALLLAYSTTIIAPSIRMPTDKIKENKTDHRALNKGEMP